MLREDLELLSPAGSYDGFLAALNAGADAIYAGGLKFGARAYAQNFSEEEFLKAIDVAHLHQKKLYMTVNTLCKEREREELLSYIRPYYEQGLDGVIVQDIGVISMLRQFYPKLPIHGSTQISVCNSEGARFLQSMGVTRVVPARELSLGEICSIHEDTGIEIEAFIHGAMCYSYSGQCLFSSMLGGRSGNRGRCAQPCRLPYACNITSGTENKSSKFTNEEYLLSMKDLCTVSILPDIIENHVTSFKIEGRMKQPEYTAAVTSIYRKYIDRYLEVGAECYSVEQKDLNLLTHSFSRIDPQTGYYFLHNGRSLITLTKPSYEQGEESVIPDSIQEQDMRISVSAYCSLLANEPASFTLVSDEYSVTVYGDICQEAIKSALDEESIRKQLSKFGDSYFKLSELNLEFSPNLFMPVKALNALRRNAIQELSDIILEKHRRESEIYKLDCHKEIYPISNFQNNPLKFESRYSVLCESYEQFRTVFTTVNSNIANKNRSNVKRIYIESSVLYKKNTEIRNMLSAWNRDADNENCIQIILALPYVFRKKDRIVLTNLVLNNNDLIDGFLIRTFDELFFIKERRKSNQILISDFNLYSFNSYSALKLKTEGIDCITYPIELNYHEMMECGSAGECELLVYGRIPMMITAGCVRKTNRQCLLADKCSDHTNISHELLPGADTLKDRYDKQFPMISDCLYCYNRILNSVPISLHGECAKINQLNPAMKRIQFSVEDMDTIEKLLSIIDSTDFSEFGFVISEFTKGHFKKSVE